LKDESATLVAGPNTIQGWSAISEFMSRVFLLVTTHFITNIRVELKDVANTASMTAHAVAYHVRPDDAFKPEDTSYTAGCLYFIDPVKDNADGLWKIKKWEIKIQSKLLTIRTSLRLHDLRVNLRALISSLRIS
jgi:SnoaL-like protein